MLRNRPTLSIGTERLACPNSPHGVHCSWGPSPSTRQFQGSSPGRAVRAFFSPPSLPFSLGRFFLAPSPPNPRKGYGTLLAGCALTRRCLCSHEPTLIVLISAKTERLKYFLSFKSTKLLNKMTYFYELKLLQKRKLSQLQNMLPF